MELIYSRISFWLYKYPNSILIIGANFNILLNINLDRWSPLQHSHTNLKLETLINKCNLVDIWRMKHPNDISFSWSNRSGSRKSHIDFRLILDNISQNNVTADILASPLTDHRAIYIKVQLLTNEVNRLSYWKLNASFLTHAAVKSKISDLIKPLIHKAILDHSYSKCWELFKYELGQILRQYGAKLAKLRAANEDNLITQIFFLFTIFHQINVHMKISHNLNLFNLN